MEKNACNFHIDRSELMGCKLQNTGFEDLDLTPGRAGKVVDWSGSEFSDLSLASPKLKTMKGLATATRSRTLKYSLEDKSSTKN